MVHSVQILLTVLVNEVSLPSDDGLYAEMYLEEKAMMDDQKYETYIRDKENSSGTSHKMIPFCYVRQPFGPEEYYGSFLVWVRLDRASLRCVQWCSLTHVFFLLRCVVLAAVIVSRLF
jgi:hypothetical protein